MRRIVEEYAKTPNQQCQSTEGNLLIANNILQSGIDSVVIQ